MEKMTYLSQEQKILAYLKQGHTLTPLQALHWYGCLRLAARVESLRKQGHLIMTDTVKRNGKRFAQYSLEGV